MKNSENLEGEVWVKHPIGIMVSNMGRVETRNKGKHYGSVRGKSYLRVYWQGKAYQIHRLICGAFKENPNNYKEVDHIDRNPLNNRIENLRWADRSMQMKNREIDYKAIAAKIDYKARTAHTDWKAKVDNTDYKAIGEKVAEKLSIPILQLNKNLEVVREWKSSMEAERKGGFNNGNINNCLKGRHKSHGGYIWRYKNGEAN